jgi:propanol-preferring alcohol dehydrogenase
LSDINAIFAKLKAGNIRGRMVLDLAMPILTYGQKAESAFVGV